MKRWITKACITLFATILVTLLAFAEESNIFVGTGTAEDPYQISTAQELRFLAERINAGDEVYNTAHYRLTKDMDLECKTFTPIGVDLDHAFRGNFDGEGHIISGLQTEIIEGYPYYGLFGVLDGGEVRNVTVVGYISGSPVSGGIVGLNHGGKVVNCMANCWVSASHSDHVGWQVIGTAGGIVGINEAGGLVANSCYTNFYHDACVYGEGIVHTNREDSRVVNCFSSGETVRFHHEGEFENSYLRYDPESLPEEREDLVWYFSAYFTNESGKLTPVNRLVGEEIKEVKKESIWGGETTLLGALNAWVADQEQDGYRFWTQEPGQYPVLGEYPSQSPFSGGTGTEEDPYQISAAQELRFLARRVNAGDEKYNAAYYLLTADINLSEDLFAGTSDDWCEYTPIGSSAENPFRGTLDGGFHMVSSMEISYDTEAHYCGLIGVLDGGTVKNLIVEGTIQGRKTSGGIVGWNKGGKVINCMSACGLGMGGGLVGKNSDGGLLANSCVTNDYVPQKMLVAGVGYSGIVMDNTEGGFIENCYTLEYRSNGRASSEEHRKHIYQFEYEPPYDTKHKRYNAWFHTDGILHPVTCMFDHPFDEDETPSEIINGETTLLGAMNAWVDAQGSEEYQRWVQRPGRYPSFGENLITCDYQVGDYVRPGSPEAFVEDGMPDGYGLTPCATFESFPMMEGVSRTVWFWQYEDYPIYDVLVDGQSVGPVLSYTFPGDGKDHAVTVRYTKAGTPRNFTPDIPYNGYPDVEESAWYGAEREGVVKEATQLGLFKGDEKGNFNPGATLTLAEAVKLAAVIRDTYRGEEYPFDQSQGESWYDTYVTYALEQGILMEGDFEDYQRAATRGEMAYLFYGNGKVLPEYEAISDRQPPDVPEDHPYYMETVLLYQAGTLRGSDALGTFHPDEPITRAEVAAIAVRVALPEKRISDG